MATYTETCSGGVQVGGTPSVGVAARDTFTDVSGTLIGSHTPDTGGSWSLHASYSGCTIAVGPGNTCQMTAGTPGLAYLSTPPGTPDYDVSAATINHITLLGANGYRAGVAGRIDVESNTFYRAKFGTTLLFDGDTYHHGVMLEKVVAGTATQLGSTAAYSDGRITLRMRGDQISVLEGDAVSIGPITDSSISNAGRAGVWFEGNSTTFNYLRLDDFAVDGQSQFFAAYSPAPSGGVQAGGSVAPAATYKPKPSGGVQVSGSATPGASFAVIVGSGGVQVGGSVTPAVAYAIEASGGVQVGGSAGGPLTFTEVASGGVQVGGSVSPWKTYRPTASGGIQVGGAVATNNHYTFACSGGVQVSGSATPSFAYTLVPSGGVQVSGHAGPPQIWAELASGGIQVGGSTAPMVTFRPQASGGVQLSGTSDSLGVVYNVTASGGIQVGGTSPLAGLSYSVYANAGDGGPIDYDDAIASTSELTFTTDVLSVPGVYKFGVRASALGLEEKNLDAYVLVRLDGSGADVSGLPSAPTGLSAWPIAGGKIRVTWAAPIGSKATGYRVYKGVGSPDYGTPAATVTSFRAVGGSASVDLDGLTDGVTYTIGVRAYNATGEERNTDVVAARADATGPAAVDGLTISTDPADWT